MKINLNINLNTRLILYCLTLFVILIILNKSVWAQESFTILKIHDPAAVCYPSTVDLTAAKITEGSTEGLKFSYFTDTDLKTLVSDPERVVSGIYYIKGVSGSTRKTWVAGSVKVTVTDKPKMVIANPVLKSLNEKADLTLSTIKSGSDEGLVYTYWYDSDAAQPLTSPESVLSGKYFIKGTSVNGCSDIQSVTVSDR